MGSGGDHLTPSTGYRRGETLGSGSSSASRDGSDKDDDDDDAEFGSATPGSISSEIRRCGRKASVAALATKAGLATGVAPTPAASMAALVAAQRLAADLIHFVRLVEAAVHGDTLGPSSGGSGGGVSVAAANDGNGADVSSSGGGGSQLGSFGNEAVKVLDLILDCSAANANLVAEFVAKAATKAARETTQPTPTDAATVALAAELREPGGGGEGRNGQSKDVMFSAWSFSSDSEAEVTSKILL